MNHPPLFNLYMHDLHSITQFVLYSRGSSMNLCSASSSDCGIFIRKYNNTITRKIKINEIPLYYFPRQRSLPNDWNTFCFILAKCFTIFFYCTGYSNVFPAIIKNKMFRNKTFISSFFIHLQ